MGGRRQQSKAEIAQGLERAYAGLLYDLGKQQEDIEAAEALLAALPSNLERMREAAQAIRTQIDVMVASIKRFQPDWTGAHVEPRQVKQNRSPFARREVGRHSVKILWETGAALGISELLAALCKTKGVPFTKELQSSLAGTVRQAMALAEERGVVVTVQQKPRKWKIAPKKEWGGAGPSIDYDFDAPPPPAASAASSP